MKVIGVDPGSRLAGYAILQLEKGRVDHIENGVIRLKSSSALSERLLHLGEDLRAILTRHQPQLVVVEKVFLGKNVSSAFTLGHARGIVLAEVARVGAVLEEYAPRAVKKGVTGHGGAEKTQVQNFLRSIFQIGEFPSEDASDALALALHGARQWQRSNQLNPQEVELR